MQPGDSLEQANAEKKREYRNISSITDGGVPFVWVLVFMGVILLSILLGHFLTIWGQNNVVQRSPRCEQPRAEIIMPTADREKEAKKLEQTLSGVTKSVDNISETFGKSMDSIRGQFLTLSKKLETEETNNKIFVETLKDKMINKKDIEDALEKKDLNNLVKKADVDNLLKKLDIDQVKMADNMKKQLTVLADAIRASGQVNSQKQINSALGEEFPQR